jgi:hypothetical protein
MKITEMLSQFDDFDRQRALGLLEGLQLAQRICNNRAEDNRRMFRQQAEQEAHVCAEVIRVTQVMIGSGRQVIPELTPQEQEMIWRIF